MTHSPKNTTIKQDLPPHIKVGQIGEDVAAKYLKNKGFKILDRNYRRKWAEIDIVARGTDDKVHFVEVKTVSYETRDILERMVTRETWRPEEMVHARKLRQIHKGVESWLADHNYQGGFQIDVLAIRLAMQERIASINHIENVILA